MRLAALTAWRLTVAGTALTGVVLAAIQYDVWWTALSQLASLAVAATYLCLAVLPHLTGRPEPRCAWLRGALATLVLLVALAYLPLRNGNLTDPYSVVEHVLTPTLVVVDFVLVSSRQVVRWWHPPTWLVPPAAYLAWYVAGDLAVYDALDPRRTTEFVASTGLLTLLVLVVGYGLAALTRRRPVATAVTVA